LPIHKSYFLEVEGDACDLRFRIEKLLQLNHVLFPDSAAKGKDCESADLRTSNPQHLGKMMCNTVATLKYRFEDS
jgi:hypothetical protein